MLVRRGLLFGQGFDRSGDLAFLITEGRLAAVGFCLSLFSFLFGLAYRLRWRSLPQGVLFARQRFRYSVRLSALLFLACLRYGSCSSYDEKSPTLLFVRRFIFVLCSEIAIRL